MTRAGLGRKRTLRTDQSAPPKATRRRLPGVNLRPGTVKQARVEAGLSLAQVGKGQVTAPAIFLIETGRTRPSLPTLEHIALRTGKPLEYFLAEPGSVTDETLAGVLELETLLMEGRFTEAITLGHRLLLLGSSAHRLGRIRYFLAQAHLKVGQPEPAATLLRDAHSHFEVVGDRLMLAECLGLEATAAYMAQKPDAQQLAERALSVCRELKPVPQMSEARLLSVLATIHVINREWETAVKLYQEAVVAAGSLFDLRRFATMYGGLSTAYRETGQLESATQYANRSIALLEVMRDRVALARAENNLGLILLAKGERSAAHEHLDHSVNLAGEANLEVGRSQLLLSLCELSLEQDHVEHARDLAEDALQEAERLQEGANVAAAHMWLGRIASRLGDDDTVDREFEQAILGLTKLGMDERLLQCHGIYAELLEKRGDLEQAYVHMKKALAASRPGLLRDDADDEEERVSSA